eukprot:Awhi_evm1s11895
MLLTEENNSPELEHLEEENSPRAILLSLHRLVELMRGSTTNVDLISNGRPRGINEEAFETSGTNLEDDEENTDVNTNYNEDGHLMPQISTENLETGGLRHRHSNVLQIFSEYFDTISNRNDMNQNIDTFIINNRNNGDNNSNNRNNDDGDIHDLYDRNGVRYENGSNYNNNRYRYMGRPPLRAGIIGNLRDINPRTSDTRYFYNDNDTYNDENDGEIDRNGLRLQFRYTNEYENNSDPYSDQLLGVFKRRKTKH